ncbi:MAG: PD40 domain-containing protein [Acidobacteria bacterium]|nr:PD40 domain-containing protein [Acidobacteriota bacterium]
MRVAVLIVSAVISSIAQSPPERVAYNILKDQKADDYEVFVSRLDGNEFKNVTNDRDVAWIYHTIPGKLLFISDRGACKRCYFLYESDADGSNVRKVSNLQLEDSWMGSRSDGEEIVVSGRIDQRVRFQLFVIDRRTGHFRRLTNEPKAAFRDPTYSPDGKKIVYVYKKDRTDRSEFEEVHIMNDDGTGGTKLTSYPPDDPMAKEFSYKAGPPKWNTKYDFISYQSNQNGKQSIYAVSPDGKKQWKLTDLLIDEGWHDWSPDGEWLVFDSRNNETGRYDVMLMNFRTKKVSRVTELSTFKYHQAPVFLKPRVSH